MFALKKAEERGEDVYVSILLWSDPADFPSVTLVLVKEYSKCGIFFLFQAISLI